MGGIEKTEYITERTYTQYNIPVAQLVQESQPARLLFIVHYDIYCVEDSSPA